jgi:radical SAM protein with 4Fe4S-binding SPASM domain
MRDIRRYDLLKSKIENLNQFLSDFENERIKASCLPSQIFLESSNTCNINCKICVKHNSESFRKKKKFLSRKTFLAMEKIFKNSSVLTYLHGFGEPLLNKNLPLFIELLKEYENHVSFFTNGVLLNEKFSDIALGKKLDHIMLSFDGASKDTFEYIRENANYEKVVNNFLTLSEKKKSQNAKYPNVEINFVVTKKNFNELPDLPALAKKIGVSAIHVKPMVTYDSNPFTIEQSKLYDKKKDKAVIKKTKAQGIKQGVHINFSSYMALSPPNHDPGPKRGERKKGRDRRIPGIRWLKKKKSEYEDRQVKLLMKMRNVCYQPWSTFYVTYDGHVKPCCFFNMKPDRAMGNLNDQSPEEIWNNSKYQEIRQMISEGSYPEGCRHCAEFNLKPSDFFPYNLKQFIEESSLNDESEVFFKKTRSSDLGKFLGYDSGFRRIENEYWEIAKTTGGHEVIVSPGNKKMALDHRRIKGNVDHFSVGGSEITVEGWALDKKDYSPVRKVVLFLDTRSIYSCIPYQIREDVSYRYGARSIKSGFSFVIPFKKNSQGHFRLFAFLKNNKAGELRFTI